MYIDKGYVSRCSKPDRITNAVPCITKTPEGRLLCAFGSGNVLSRSDYADPTKIATIMISESKDEGGKWSEPELLFYKQGIEFADPNFLWIGHKIACYATGLSGPYPQNLERNRTFVRMSNDYGKSWDDMTEIDLPFNFVAGKQHHGLCLQNGILVMGYSFEATSQEGKGHASDEGLMHLVSGLLRSTDGGYTWKPGDGVSLEKSPKRQGGLDEPAFVELPDGEIYALFRNTEAGWFYEARSHDCGLTWYELKPASLHSYGTPASLLLLKDNSVLVLWDNCTDGRRSPLCVAQSFDGCRSWSLPVMLDNDDWVCYPSIVQADSGLIVAAYWHYEQMPTAEPWPPSEIRLVRFYLEWLLTKQF